MAFGGSYGHKRGYWSGSKRHKPLRFITQAIGKLLSAIPVQARVLAQVPMVCPPMIWPFPKDTLAASANGWPALWGQPAPPDPRAPQDQQALPVPIAAM